MKNSWNNKFVWLIIKSNYSTFIKSNIHLMEIINKNSSTHSKHKDLNILFSKEEFVIFMPLHINNW